MNINQKLIKSKAPTSSVDSNIKTSIKFRRPCRVCGDRSSGYHYGVTSCEGCKGFFRRSIQKQITYKCVQTGKCEVNRLTRNRCQHCRFRKCLAIGMSREAVRYGRAPQQSKDLPEILVHVSTQSSVTDLSDQITLDEKISSDIINCIKNSYKTNYSTFTDELIKNLPRKVITTSLADNNTNEELEKILLWQEYADRITPNIQRFIEFSKRVPGFCDVTQDDQLILIKLGFFEIWLSQIVKISTNSTYFFTFDDGYYLTEQQIQTIYDIEFVTLFTEFLKCFNECQNKFNDCEIGLFAALILLTPKKTGLSDAKEIEKNRDIVLKALCNEILKSDKTKTLQNIRSSLDDKLGKLRILADKHYFHILWIRENFQKIKLPPLFAELFDIPKFAENLGDVGEVQKTDDCTKWQYLFNNMEEEPSVHLL